MDEGREETRAPGSAAATPMPPEAEEHVRILRMNLVAVRKLEATAISDFAAAQFRRVIDAVEWAIGVGEAGRLPAVDEKRLVERLARGFYESSTTGKWADVHDPGTRHEFMKYARAALDSARNDDAVKRRCDEQPE